MAESLKRKNNELKRMQRKLAKYSKKVKLLEETSNSSDGKEQVRQNQNDDASQGDDVFAVEDGKEETDQTKFVEVPDLDDEILVVLEAGPTNNQHEPFEIRSELRKRWTNRLVNGLNEKEEEDLSGKYMKADFLIMQKLDTEVKVALQNSAYKRDNFFVNYQDSLGVALMALGTGLIKILNGWFIRCSSRY
ncbi:hypothetical protein ABEB36_012681 [Hypothenemus hampei]|uniref:Uncharacterized protein n=1 Tax=Hypothenemus hampei TaxID=57062 RepID=A0ABD1EC22_HYPHA